jgi:probable HAF family extracellular repeat protein
MCQGDLAMTRARPSRAFAQALSLVLFALLAACGSGDDGGGGGGNIAPTAAFTAVPDSGVAPLAVSFDGSSSTDRDGSVVGYAWDFGDQSASATGVQVDHTFQAAGSYTVTLTVTDNRSATASTSRTITVVANAVPTADFTASPQSGIVPLVVRFDAAASQDPDGSIVSYAWDFADGGTATGMTAQHTFVAAGVFEVTLSVTDDDGATASAVRPVNVLSPVAAARYSATLIPSLGGPFIEPSAINNRGEVVGFSTFDGTGAAHAFLYSNGLTRDLGTLGGRESFARDVNDSGVVVGWSETADLSERAFRYIDGTMQDLGTLGGLSSEADGVNSAGHIVGSSTNLDGFMRGFVLRDGAMVPLGTLGGDYSVAAAINGQGQIAGWSMTAAGQIHAFLQTGNVLNDLGTLGGDQAYVAAMNDAGDVVGESALPAAGLTGYLYRDGAMRQLVDGYSEPLAINNAGVIVGYAHFATVGAAFVWDEVKGLQNLNDLIDPALGWTIQVAAGINDLGQIAGHGYRSGGAPIAVLLTPETSAAGSP